LLAFQQLHPAITLRVLFSNWVFDLIGVEVDVAVRACDQTARCACCPTGRRRGWATPFMI
jgi:DNA-binding transcriptional LysR family regulator